ncbi:MAG TPA: hypothetical protein VE757_03270, partial [Gaiellaceae bacterium]|nr:hypothetical protein [Gaiellaceae bacterium]
FLQGGPGEDRFVGGYGNDLINSRDGLTEHVYCGEGKDTGAGRPAGHRQPRLREGRPPTGETQAANLADPGYSPPRKAGN